MTRQSLREREAAVCMDQLSGKLSVHAIRDHLKANGFIEADIDLVEQWELAETRRIIASVRKYREQTDDVQLELVNLWEQDGENPKEFYYKKVSELTPEESAQLLGYCNGHRVYWEKKFNRYYKPLMKRHGKKLQRLLNFDFPQPPGKQKSPRKPRNINPSAN